MSGNKQNIEPKIGGDPDKIDAYVLGPDDYDEVPEIDDAWFDSAVFHF
jgi:hypothetical protein